MAAVCVEEDLAVQAARILLTLKSRRPPRRPERVEKDPATAVLEVGWPKRKRSGGRRPAPELLRPGHSASAGSSGEERERHPRWMERPRAPGPVRYELPAVKRPDDGAPSGSVPSTSADHKARPRHAVDVAERPKEPMKAASPETPLDFGAGSGASWSGDDAARPPSKRRPVGSACSGDEGCSSPDKRARVAKDSDGDNAVSEPKMEAPAKFAFDLNMLPEDEECPGFC